MTGAVMGQEGSGFRGLVGSRAGAGDGRDEPQSGRAEAEFQSA